jgi:hypothetical protein
MLAQTGVVDPFHRLVPHVLATRIRSRLSPRDSMTVIRPRANQFFLATILALYGVITLSGPALHALPGFGHRATELASDREAAPGQGDQENAAAHDCPICHFHAQGQLIADPDGAPSMEIVRIRPADEPQLSSPLAVARPSIPRAPPLA